LRQYLLIDFVELSKWIGTREPTRLTKGLGRVGLNFFYKFYGSPTRK